MRQLWAPWRVEFITQPKPGGCILCSKPGENQDYDNYILHRAEHSFVMMNIYPYNNGHLLVSPYKHAATLDALDDSIMLDLMRTMRTGTDAVKRALSPEGINIGLNLGRTAGAGIEEHLHFHIVPRWHGDTSFMAVLAEVRVIPEHLRVTYEKLAACFPRSDKGRGADPKGGRK